MKAFKYFPLVVLLAACGQSVKTTTTTTDTNKVVSTTATVTKVNTAIFDKPVVIVVEPSARLIKIEKDKQEASSYNTVVGDNVFYLAQSNHYLDSVKANKVNRESEGTIKFKSATGQTYDMKLDELFFGIILFNGKDKPMMGDMTNLKVDYEKYMK